MILKSDMKNKGRIFHTSVCQIARRSAFFNLSSSFNNSAKSQQLIARLAVFYSATHYEGVNESSNDWVMLYVGRLTPVKRSPLLSFFEGEITVSVLEKRRTAGRIDRGSGQKIPKDPLAAEG